MKHTYEPHGDNWTLVTIMMFSCSLIFVRRYRSDAGDRAKLSVHCNNLSFRSKGMVIVGEVVSSNPSAGY